MTDETPRSDNSVKVDMSMKPDTCNIKCIDDLIEQIKEKRKLNFIEKY